MAKTQKTNIIEINGRRYDARTGKAVAAESVTKPAASKPATHHASVAKPVKPAAAKPVTATTKPRKQVAVHAVRPVAAPTTRKPQPTRTLARRTVAKPTRSRQQSLRAQSHTDALVKQPTNQVVPKTSSQEIDERRLKHAQGTPRSGLIRHFSAGHHETSGAVVVPASPSLPTASGSAALTVNPINRTEQLLRQAMMRATSHQQPAHQPVRHSRRHLVWKVLLSAAVIASVVLATLLKN